MKFWRHSPEFHIELGFECYKTLKSLAKFHIELGVECYKTLKSLTKFHIELGFGMLWN
jgi:hypothetical protein